MLLPLVQYAPVFPAFNTSKNQDKLSFMKLGNVASLKAKSFMLLQLMEWELYHLLKLRQAERQI